MAAVVAADMARGGSGNSSGGVDRESGGGNIGCSNNKGRGGNKGSQGNRGSRHHIIG